MKVNKLVKIAVAVAVALHIADAKAASYQLNDYSVTGLGRSYAGAGIMGDDYSAIAYNPAGMTLMKKSGVQQVFNMINVNSDVEGLDEHKGSKGKMKFWQPVPAGFAQYNVNDKFFLGAGIYAPFGLKTKYKANWFGKDAAILSKLDIVDFNISAAYKLDQHWSFGASAILRYIYGRMTQKIGTMGPYGGGDINFNVHGWSQTGTLGVMYEVDKNTRFGASWRLRSAQRAKGKFKMSGINPAPSAVLPPGMTWPSYLKDGMTDVWANPDLPETVTLSAYHRYKDVGFSGTARWTHWTSSFPNFTVYSSSLPEGKKTNDYRYKNSWTLSGGMDYYYCKNLTFRLGAGWDQSPTNGAKRRTIRIPDSDRWWMSVGASYMKNNWQLDVGYAHLIAKTAKSLEDKGTLLSDPVHAKYKNTQSNILGVQVQYKF
ncbi:MAG: outer membrane protein transport protein [Alphaproteobacteria bacterium]|nr:outer membrane protein transport protein [Alphaproteobacteria bacterium]